MVYPAKVVIFSQTCKKIEEKIITTFYSRADGTTKPTTRQPIKPAAQTTIRMEREDIKKIVEIATIVAINNMIYTRLRAFSPPFA